MTITIDAGHAGTPWTRFWRSTGFTPAELLLEPEMRQTLAYLGAVPNRGVEYLRVHYMLDLVTASRIGRYEWSLLDAALDAHVEAGLKPFFELMGNPSRLFTDFSDRTQAEHWRDLIAELARRCLDRYGADEVRSWYFETWNEPDIWWRHGGETGFNNYYDACSEALKAVDPTLRFGGPGTARTLAPMFKSILAHCDTGTNLFTGEQGVRIDFISVHEKGVKKHVEDLTPNSVGICDRELKAVDYIRTHHPRLADRPFINNECDPQIGWILSHTWHATPYFAGICAKIIDQHQRRMADQARVPYAVLSNDNGFIGRWGHRTHLAYFGERAITAAQADHVTDLAALADRRANPKPFELIKKPALSVMELLGLLGDDRLPVAADGLDPDRDGIGAMATRLASGDLAILIYYSVDRIWQSGRRRIRLALDGLPAGDYALATLRIADQAGDPFSVWEQAGAPDLPDAAVLAATRAAQEPAQAVRRLRHQGGRRELAIDLLLPSVTLLVLARRGAPPAVPTALRADRYPGLAGDNRLLTWRPGAAPGVQRFEVHYAPDPKARFERISAAPLLSSAFLHASAPASGRYRVVARDLFGQASPPSAVLTVPT